MTGDAAIYSLGAVFAVVLGAAAIVWVWKACAALVSTLLDGAAQDIKRW